MQNQLFEKIYKIDKTLVRLTKNKREKTQSTKIRNASWQHYHGVKRKKKDYKEKPWITV